VLNLVAPVMAYSHAREEEEEARGRHSAIIVPLTITTHFTIHETGHWTDHHIFIHNLMKWHVILILQK
jgi:hypothetical protein